MFADSKTDFQPCRSRLSPGKLSAAGVARRGPLDVIHGLRERERQPGDGEEGEIPGERFDRGCRHEEKHPVEA